MQQDNKQKKINELWIVFLIIIALIIALNIVAALLYDKGVSLPLVANVVLNDVVMIVPVLAYILKYKLDIRKDLGFCRIKAGTIAMTILIGVLVIPIASFVNVLSQLFVSNTMTQSADMFTEGSSLMVLFLTGFLAPFCEEFLMRGFMCNTFGKYTTPIKAIFISAIMFSLMHLNINQAAYALVLGIIFAIVNHASGSVYTSMIIHTVVNSLNIAVLIAVNGVFASNGGNVAEAAETARQSSMIYVTAALYMVLAIISIAICIPCVVWVAKHENRYEQFVALFINNKKKIESVAEDVTESESTLEDSSKVRAIINVPAIIVIVACFIFMFGIEIFL